MLNYNANSFNDLFAVPLGQDLWKFLNEHDSVLCLKLASDLQRPAVEGITEELYKRFGNKIKEDRWKQMTGHMIRQILENEGYQLQSSNIKVRFGDVFSYGSKYNRK
jgi:hypothetical protein